MRRNGGCIPLQGRAPLALLVIGWINPETPSAPRARPETVEIDGTVFAPGLLKGYHPGCGRRGAVRQNRPRAESTAYATAIRFLSVGNYLPDGPKVEEEIVGRKSGPTCSISIRGWPNGTISKRPRTPAERRFDRKESYTVTDGAPDFSTAR